MNLSTLTEANFDDAYYLDLYPDVAKVYGGVPGAGWLHWYTYGYAEGRVARGLDWPPGVNTNHHRQAPPGEVLHAVTCNVCGRAAHVPLNKLSKREEPSCPNCGSSLRMRSIIHALSLRLFGHSLALPDFPVDKNIRGLGLSDWDGYALPLANKLAYVNTYLHQEPRLNILDISNHAAAHYDFLISSDVFEHVPPPVELAFVNSLNLLKPGGLLVLTVPYTDLPATREHFPALHDYNLREENGRRRLYNTTRDGRSEVFDDLVFHGGEGFTLEMRVFGRSPLMDDLRAAGFSEIQLHNNAYQAWGITPMPGAPITARRPQNY